MVSITYRAVWATVRETGQYASCSSNHMQSTCKFRNAKCYKCHKKVTPKEFVISLLFFSKHIFYIQQILQLLWCHLSKKCMTFYHHFRLLTFHGLLKIQISY